VRFHLIVGLSSAVLLVAASPSLAQTPARGACPAATFSDFLAKFMDDPQVQRAFTLAPLVSSHVRQDDVGEPQTVTKRLAAGDIGYPVMPSRAWVATNGRQIAIGGDAVHPDVKVFKPDTDMQAHYRFERAGCWRLIEVADQSL
jgi:hypothetical protein